MKITKKDRIILINQYKILAALNPNENDRYNEIIEILERGYSVFYSMIDEWISEDMPREKSYLVFDILDFYRALEDFKRKNESSLILKNNFQYFPGFDGNHESEYLGFTRFLIEDQGKFTEQRLYLSKNDNLNSHFPMIEKYTKMIYRWKEKYGRRYQLTEPEFIEILDV